MKPFKKGTDINKQDEDLKRRKVFVKGLPNTCDKARLVKAFSQFGQVDKTYILYDHNNGASRGFGFVEFLHEADVSKALQASISIDGKIIRCSRVILKQEAKLNQFEENKPSLDIKCTDTKGNGFKSQKPVKSKNKPRFNTLAIKDEACYDDATKESSENDSCGKKGQYLLSQMSDPPADHPQVNEPRADHLMAYDQSDDCDYNNYCHQQEYSQYLPQQAYFTGATYNHWQFGATYFQGQSCPYGEPSFADKGGMSDPSFNYGDALGSYNALPTKVNKSLKNHIQVEASGNHKAYSCYRMF